MGLPGDGFLRNQGLKMRLSDSFPQFRTVLAIPFLAAMLAFPASAETTPNGPPAATQSGPASPETGPNGAPAASPSNPDTSATSPNGAPPAIQSSACDPCRPAQMARPQPLRRIPILQRPVLTGHRQPPLRALQPLRLARKPRRSPPHLPRSQMAHPRSLIRLRARRALHLRSPNPVSSSISTNRRKR